MSVVPQLRRVGKGALSRRCMVGKFAIAPLPSVGASTAEFAHPAELRRNRQDARRGRTCRPEGHCPWVRSVGKAGRTESHLRPIPGGPGPSTCSALPGFGWDFAAPAASRLPPAAGGNELHPLDRPRLKIAPGTIHKVPISFPPPWRLINLSIAFINLSLAGAQVDIDRRASRLDAIVGSDPPLE